MNEINLSVKAPYDVMMVNDTAALNVRYRSTLMRQLKGHGFRPISKGLFENRRLQFGRWVANALRWHRPIISSNLRTNILTLSLPHLRGLVILNGLGRYRRSLFIRRVLLFLIRINFRKSVAIQNYADYRYFRRNTRSAWLAWVPGSGGTKRKVGDSDVAIVVQRNDKIELVAPSLVRLIRADLPFRKILLVGCTTFPNSLTGFSKTKVVVGGYVDQEVLFAQGRYFVQPKGYGEGIPHSLVDAILSDMEIWIDHRQFTQMGLSRLGIELNHIVDGWGQIGYSAERLFEVIGEEAISKRYVELFALALNGTSPTNAGIT